MIIANKKLIIVSIITLAIMGTAIYLYPRITKPDTSNISSVVSTSTPIYAITPVPTASTTSSTVNDTHPGMKLYRNKEFGFEFEYPKNWKLEENSFGSPFSKFNLEGDSSAKDYNPDMAAFLINIVAPDFAERAVISMKKMHATMSDVMIGGTQGVKYEYIFESVPQVDIYIYHLGNTK